MEIEDSSSNTAVRRLLIVTDEKGAAWLKADLHHMVVVDGNAPLSQRAGIHAHFWLEPADWQSLKTRVAGLRSPFAEPPWSMIGLDNGVIPDAPPPKRRTASPLAVRLAMLERADRMFGRLRRYQEWRLILSLKAILLAQASGTTPKHQTDEDDK